MKNIYIGVDPGKTGFITILKDGEYKFFPMPEHKIETGEFLQSGKPKLKKVFYEEGLKDVLFDIARECKGRIVVVGIEKVIGRGGWSAGNNFIFGYMAGMMKMMFITLGFKIIMVRPQKWQAYIRLTHNVEQFKKDSSTGKTKVNDPKAVADEIVSKHYSNIDFRKTVRAKNNDSNKIDSFLICKYIENNF